jgi:glycosyltransferase involved in cell wall biosynthesis
LKKILIIGPIGDFGGREIECGFIAKSLSKKFDVYICSTGNLSAKSQVFDFVSSLKVFSITDLVYKNDLSVRISSFFSWIKNCCKSPVSFYVKSKFNKGCLNIENKIQNQIKNQVENSDCILICAQLSSNYIEIIINHAYQFNKPVFFRTTGAIGKIEKKTCSYLIKVTQFIHHSEKNAFNLNSQENFPYVIIDQCAYNEQSLLQIEQLEKKVTTFITIARLVKEKNIDVVIKAFLKIKENGDQLFVVGDGLELKALQELAFGEPSVIFTGFVSNIDLTDFFRISDCVVISHCDGETGPLTGIEAMAAGKLLLSAKTGAMPERLPNNEFWFDNSIDDLVIQMQKVKEMDAIKVAVISAYNRKRYLESYSEVIIRQAYIKAAQAFLGK